MDSSGLEFAPLLYDLKEVESPHQNVNVQLLNSHILEVAMSLIRIKRNYQITIPAEVRKELGLDEDDWLHIEIEGNRIVFTPLSAEELDIKAAIAEALEDVKAGRVSPAFSSAEELRAWLDEE